jgi:hypothetical protein
MRVYGRPSTGLNVNHVQTFGPWVEVDTDPSGDNADVYITWLAQVLLLNLNESPFFGNWGIPAKDSVMQQVAPDIFVALIQQRFAPFFASIIVARKQGQVTPTYDISIITKQGAKLNHTIAVPI